MIDLKKSTSLHLMVTFKQLQDASPYLFSAVVLCFYSDGAAYCRRPVEHHITVETTEPVKKMADFSALLRQAALASDKWKSGLMWL